ncbi:MAG: UDP-N-acetylglucosamine 2-epimerase (non-hydrolyzing) [Cyclobacteriaceae bacterium]
MKKILLIVGTRPEALKVIPVYLAFKKKSFGEVKLVSTGQHKEMLDQIFDFFQIKPDVELNLMKKNQTLAQISSLLFKELDKVLTEEKPDVLMVQGDTTSAMVAGITAYYHKVKVAHIEAGLRSFNNLAPFPEEVNRKIISQIASIHFAPTRQAQHNLKKEGATNVYVVGNTAIDCLLLGKSSVKQNIEYYRSRFSGLNKHGRKLVLITAHRRESFGEGLQNICAAIKTLSAEFTKCDFAFPVHLNPNIQQPVQQKLGSIENVFLLPPLPYDDMVFLLSRAYMVLTDSGGIQEEAPSMNVPLIVLRDVTERPEGIKAGCSVLGGTSAKRIVETFRKIFLNDGLYKKMSTAKNPYGDGQTARRIVSLMAAR